MTKAIRNEEKCSQFDSVRLQNDNVHLNITDNITVKSTCFCLVNNQPWHLFKFASVRLFTAQ